MPTQSADRPVPAPFSDYEIDAAYDEMFRARGRPRPQYRNLYAQLQNLPSEELHRCKKEADLSFFNQGITFTVYGRGEGTEQIFPHDLLPRIVTNSEWATIERGLTQRITALNLFLADVYHEGRIVRDRVVPGDIVYTCKHFRRQMHGVKVPHDVYVSVVGTDLIRLPDGRFVVLEDNLRVPSGVSYMLTSRKIMKQIFPTLFRKCGVRPIEQYCQALLSTLRSLVSEGRSTIVLLTPGVYNSAYFEHAFLARQMGIELVEGRDLVVRDNKIYMRTTSALRRVDVMYRRVDDDFVDPLAFRRDSSLGVAGLFNAYRTGNVVLTNALGTGVADDKATYSYVPKIIRYYLGEDPVVDNVETFLMTDRAQREHVSGNMEKYVVKAVGESGGYGMLIGPHSSREERAAFRDKILADALELLTTLNAQLYQYFSYVKQSTGVNSAIEGAIRSRQGVCQDFAHTMISIVRNLRIPCRYVSGYLHRDPEQADRSDEGATHAWVEVLLPRIGWVGFDPANNLIVGGRHIRTAIGRDYADVSPTVGAMKGTAETELQVRVRVTPSDALLPPDQEFAADEEWSRFLENAQQTEKLQAQQQQQ